MNASNNPKVTTVNHLVKLEILDVSWNCGINNAGIVNCINLESLSAIDNPKITNVNHLVKLEKIVANGICKINEAGIAKY